MPRELYDLERDPRERANLASERPEIADRLSRTLAAWIERDSRPLAPTALSPEERQQHEALGYAEPQPLL